MPMHVIALFISLAGMTVLTPGVQVATGTVSGYVTDTGGAPLPGVTITVNAAEATLRAVSDVKGRFVVASVPPGTAVIEASLAGFKSVRRENIAIRPGMETRVDLSMCVSGLAEIDWVFSPSYPDYLNRADAVLHVRITATVLSRPECGQSGWLHTATILHAVKAPPDLAAQSTVTFFQEYWMEEQTPYPLGSELVLPLVKSSGWYTRLTGPHGVFVVTENKVYGKLPPSFGTSYNGTELDYYLAELRRLIGK